MNKAMLIGYVGKEPEVKYYDADQAVAQFSLATTERGYTLQNGTRVPDRTDWHNIVMWHGLAKFAEKNIHKGDRLYVEGRIRNRYYDDNKGVRRFITEIYAENIELLTQRHPRNDEAGTNQQQTSYKPTNNTANSTINENKSAESDDVLPF